MLLAVLLSLASVSTVQAFAPAPDGLRWEPAFGDEAGEVLCGTLEAWTNKLDAMGQVPLFGGLSEHGGRLYLFLDVETGRWTSLYTPGVVSPTFDASLCKVEGGALGVVSEERILRRIVPID